MDTFDATQTAGHSPAPRPRHRLRLQARDRPRAAPRRWRRTGAWLAAVALLGAAPAGAGPVPNSPLVGPVQSGPAPAEAEQMPALPAPVPDGLPWQSPSPGARPEDLLRPFDAPARPWDPGHRGVDLRLHGDVVLAPADGTVRHAGMVAGRPVLSLDHGEAVVSSMEPVVAFVEEGERVRAGQPIGRLDPTAGHCAVPCVHLGVRVLEGWAVGSALRDRYLDPAVLLGLSGPSVLWPVRQEGH